MTSAEKKIIENTVTSEIGYYSYIQINLISIFETNLEAIHKILKSARFKEMPYDKKTKLFYFEHIATLIYPMEEYLITFKKLNWADHMVDAFNNKKVSDEKLEELEKIINNGI